MEIQQIKSAALAKRNAGDFAGAEAMFRQALTAAPDDLDCLHMLGVLCFRTNRAREAMEFFFRAGMLSGWRVPAITRNFGLASNHVYGDDIIVKRIAYRAWLSVRQRAMRPSSALVTVVVPSYNHARFIAVCLNSVYRQTWRRIELVVIDDGSVDDSVAQIRQLLLACPFPHTFIARENRGAHETINEAIAVATGDYINILNSDDCFHPQRIEKMVAHVAGMGADWGFAGVEILDDRGVIAPSSPESASGKLKMIVAGVDAAPTIGFALLRHNVAISTGNFFIRREFFREMGGFSDLRYVHDQEFALRATLVSEPIYVAEKLYGYRVHGSNTISETGSTAGAETGAMLDQHIQNLLSPRAVPNPFAPTRANWGEYVTSYVLRYGFGGLPSAAQLAEIAQQAMGNYAAKGMSNGEGMAGSATGADTWLSRVEGLAGAQPLLATMSTPPNGIQATFDQFQRYGIVARTVEHLRRAGQVFTILEVGANTHRILGKLLPNDKITYLDREIPPEMQGANDVLIGDATQLNMLDGAFDLVVALDVFEHIESPRREFFLRHITRVSRIATMLGAPFASAAVRAAEDSACQFWDGLFSKPYRWLVEHAENGLPDLAQTRQTLADLGMQCVHFGHGNLPLWRELMKAHFAAEFSTELRAPVAAMDSYYRDHLLLADVSENATYRQFLLCTRDAAVRQQLADFPASLVANSSDRQPPVDLESLMEVLHAMQQIAVVAKRVSADS